MSYGTNETQRTASGMETGQAVYHDLRERLRDAGCFRPAFGAYAAKTALTTPKSDSGIPMKR